ncbi:MAG TPA: hypothetical protein VLU46_12265 [Thermoanaerobaculia bacterium]|nr:hypothetical protein [Thermoanaerobaculia bacterium]
MTPNNRSLALGAVLLALGFVPRADATLMKAATFDEKVENAASIVLGTAVRKESRWDADHRWILTYTTFRVEKTLKGAGPVQPEVTLVTPGGTVGDDHQETVGVPEFDEGSEHVLFIRNTRVGPTVLYFDQGAYDVGQDEHGERIVKPIASDAVTIDTQRGVAVAPESPRRLDQFERDVRDSERRAVVNRMELIKKQQAAAAPSIWQILGRNKYLVLLALAGAAIATLQWLKR